MSMNEPNGLFFSIGGNTKAITSPPVTSPSGKGSKDKKKESSNFLSVSNVNENKETSKLEESNGAS